MSRLTKTLRQITLSTGVAITLALAADSRTISQVQQRRVAPSSALTTLETATTQSTVQVVASVSMTVSQMEPILKFYTETLPFRKISDVEVWGSEYEHLQGVFGVRMRVVQLQLGSEVIELIDYLTPEGKPLPADSRSNDHWFQHIAIVVRDMEQAYQHLRRHRIQYVSTNPQRLPEYLPAAAGIEAFYFRDPDGHNIEIIHYPNGKGDPRWQQPQDQLFLGIDHTAIAVSNTQASLNFYQGLLGLKVAGVSENYGTEQEHLNNVFGARLKISGLKATAGIGIEFLDYLTPADGRLMPADARANDLVGWQTTMVVKDADAAAQRLQLVGYSLVSSGVVTMPDQQLGFRKGFLVRDPDGHLLRIVEK